MTSIEGGLGPPHRHPPHRTGGLRRAVLLACAFVCAFRPSAAAGDVAPPAEVLGVDPAASGSILGVSELLGYSAQLAANSPRATLFRYGISTEGRPLWGILIAEPGRLDAVRAGDPGDPLVVLITCGIHPSEVASSPASLPILHRLVSSEESALDELRRRAVTIVVPTVNPDGTDRVAEWLRGAGRRARSLPVLSHRYTGHDLNRDWIVGTQAEVRALVARIHRPLRPWITIDLHQTGALGPRLFVPPYADPVDPSVAPDLLAELDRIGGAVLTDLSSRGHRGIARRWVYDAWTPARAYPLYHGGLRFLVEAASARWVFSRAVHERELWVFGRGNDATPDHPYPWRGGLWGMPQTIALLEDATVAALAAMLDGDPRRARDRHRATARAQSEAVEISAGKADPRVVDDLLGALRFGGARVRAKGRDLYEVRDPVEGIGWTRSLLTCIPYPPAPSGDESDRDGRTTFNSSPYDSSVHDLAHFAGVETRVIQSSETGVNESALGAARATPPPGTLRTVSPDVRARGGAWVVTPRSIAFYAELADLIEAGARIERVVDAVNDFEDLVRPGDFLLRGPDSSWIERIVDDGSDARELTAEELVLVGSSDVTRAFRYPDVYVLRGTRPAKDEGWLRWVLEDAGVRFRHLDIEELAVPADSFARETRGGPVVLLAAEGTLRRPRPELRLQIESAVASGARVVSFGRASRWMATTCDLPLAEVSLESDAFPGVMVEVSSAVPFSSRARDALLWGYDRGFDVFVQGGVLWTPPASPLSRAVLRLSGNSRRCAPRRFAAGDSIGASLLATYRREGAAGEWVLFGFRPYFRGWTGNSLRLLLNALFSPVRE